MKLKGHLMFSFSWSAGQGPNQTEPNRFRLERNRMSTWKNQAFVIFKRKSLAVKPVAFSTSIGFFFCFAGSLNVRVKRGTVNHGSIAGGRIFTCGTVGTAGNFNLCRVASLGNSQSEQPPTHSPQLSAFFSLSGFFSFHFPFLPCSPDR